MLRSVASRVLVGGLVVLGGFGGLATSALPASAGTKCPSPAPNLCVTPNSGVVQHQIVQVVVWSAPNATVAITECNHNLAAQDPNACDSAPADLGKPGGPALGQTNASGKAVFSYPVRVNTTKPVGDGTCAPGGDTCFIVAADPATMQLLANPAPFTTA